MWVTVQMGDKNTEIPLDSSVYFCVFLKFCITVQAGEGLRVVTQWCEYCELTDPMWSWGFRLSPHSSPQTSSPYAPYNLLL